MKICQIIPRLAATPDGTLVGGPPNTMLKLAKAQQAMGHDLSILAGCPGKESAENAKAAFPSINIRSILINPKSAGPLRGAEFIFKGLAHALRHRSVMMRYNVLHSHSGYHHLAALTAAIGKSTGVPMVHTLYCPIITEVEERRNWLLSLKTARMVFRGINRIVVVSKNIERSLLEAGIEAKKIRKIPPGIDTHQFHPKVSGRKWRHKLGVPDKGILIFYVGNLVKAKGLDVLIEALKSLARKVPNLYFAYALQLQHSRFEPRRNDYRQALKEIPLGAPARELGPVSHIEELMASADVFVAPLRTTNGLADYPISIMEAMAAGKPVVATKVGGVREIISHEENGLLARPGNHDDLAEQILRVATSSDLAIRLGANARQSIKNNFSINQLVERTMELYEELLIETGFGPASCHLR